MRGRGGGPRRSSARTAAPTPASRLRPWRPAAVGPLLLVSAALMACEPFDLGAPDRARVVLEGPSGTSLQLITSNHVLRAFTDDGSEVIELVEADTSVIALPFSNDYSIVEREAQYNFYVRAAAADSQSVVVRMQVLVDDEEWYDQERDLTEQPHDFLFLR